MIFKTELLKLICISGFFCIPEMLFAQDFDLNKSKIAYEKNHINNLKLELQKADTATLTFSKKAYWDYYFAVLNNHNDKQAIAFDYMLKAKKKFSKINLHEKIIDCNLWLIEIANHQNSNKIDTQSIMKELENEIPNKKNYDKLVQLYRNLGIKHLNNDNAKMAIYYFNKTIPIAAKQKDCVKIAYAYMNIGTVYSALLNKPDSSLYFNQKAIPFLKKHGDVTTLALNYNNQGLQYKLKNKYKEAIHYYLKALSTPIRKNVTKTKLVFYENLAEAYALNKNYEQSTKYLNLINQLKDSINESKQNIAISEINEKYNNEKLRADNLEIDSKRKKNKFLLIGTIIILVLGTIIFLLIQKNTLRKQRLAEKEKELETQKLATVLKEQELTTIDAMIEGQEKERIRIANDLHDDLGSLLANVKLHFDALKEKKSEDLYTKTHLLIDETYQKVRSIAHAKNSGVIAKQGLLKAVQQLASKTSLSNKIEINVIDHGLEERLENSLELSIFRIIQELITNILKHAYATEASIYLTCFDNNLNIMVEDNGKGFNSRKTLKKNTGMGIHSIDKRVEHLNGTMTIESEPKNGTTIIIDLPI